MGKVAAKRLASQTAQTKAELILGHPIFPGESGVDQLVEIIKVCSSEISVFLWFLRWIHLWANDEVLGTPTREELMAMNPNYTEQLGRRLVGFTWPVRFALYTHPLIGRPGDQNRDLLWGAPPLGPRRCIFPVWDSYGSSLDSFATVTWGDITRCCTVGRAVAKIFTLQLVMGFQATFESLPGRSRTLVSMP